jgi:hypothetical protein
MNVLKYARETNLNLCLADYQLAYQASGTDSDEFIIQNLPLYLTELARTWLEHLPSDQIKD